MIVFETISDSDRSRDFRTAHGYGLFWFMDKGGLSRIKMLVFSRDFKARDVVSFIKIG